MPSKKRVAQSRWSTKHAYMESSELGFCGVTGCTEKEQLCSRTEISRARALRVGHSLQGRQPFQKKRWPLLPQCVLGCPRLESKCAWKHPGV